MDRKSFIKNGCLICLGVIGSSVLLQSCASSTFVLGNLQNQQISIEVSSFLNKNGSAANYRIVENDDLSYSIVVYRRSETAYESYLLQCTHQGAALNVYGSRMECSAHGSQFDDHGHVLQGPASQPLQKLTTNLDNNTITIFLS